MLESIRGRISVGTARVERAEKWWTVWELLPVDSEVVTTLLDKFGFFHMCLSLT